MKALKLEKFAIPDFHASVTNNVMRSSTIHLQVAVPGQVLVHRSMFVNLPCHRLPDDLVLLRLEEWYEA